ncbi:peptidase S16 [Epidermidibacterium keratini]|uniref:Peptidase S16 n=1 Tax=Epidermidibacterium keratini TaxID=1891644 RepID=A0A7L4YM45_9ACTN|nr:LON peptidase substrate-binding domain-containing protein [Epidermidibacterium keratini]QHB99903.1 peptidase S16 [Epidermidibacterium keratini]
MQSLPLFPLGTVLLPTGRLPLQIFEPRYVQLLQDLAAMPVDERVLGIVAIRRGHEVGEGQASELHEVGCVARVEHITIAAPGTERRLGVMLTGERPFALHAIDGISEKPYTVGNVAFLDDDGRVDPGLLADLAEVHRTYLETLGAEPLHVSSDPAMAAYDAAEKSLLTLQDKQRLLETRNASERVTSVIAMLRRETALVRKFGAVPRQSPPGESGLN